MTLYLIGAGGHADDIAPTIGPHAAAAHHTQLPVLAPCDQIIIGINDPQTRAKIAAELGVRDETWVHPDARIYVDCHLGYGTHINYGVTMTRTTIGKHCTIAPGVTICGDVTIGDRVLIGADATICEKVVIENDVTVGAGAVVTPGHWDENHEMVPRILKAGCTYMGVPAELPPKNFRELGEQITADIIKHYRQADGSYR